MVAEKARTPGRTPQPEGFRAAHFNFKAVIRLMILDTYSTLAIVGNTAEDGIWIYVTSVVGHG